MTRWAKASVVGYASTSGESGFALPLFRPDAGQELLIQQIDEWTGRVVGFFQADIEPTSLLTVCADVRVGESQLFIFVEASGDLVIGNLAHISARLRTLAPNCSIEIRIQIAELVGTAEERFQARSAMHKLLSRSEGREAARLYRNAALRAELWQLLLAEAPDYDAAQEILFARSKLRAWVRGNGAIEVDVSALDSSKFSWVDIEALRTKLASGFPNLHATSQDEKLVIEPIAQQQLLSIENILDRVQGIPRQEQRIAILLAAIAEEADMAERVLRRYAPRTHFESRAFDILRRYLAADSQPHNLPWEALVELATVKIYNQLYPRHRGRFLFFLAQYLGHHRAIAEFVRERTVASNSMDILIFADDIFIELERHHWVIPKDERL